MYLLSRTNKKYILLVSMFLLSVSASASRVTQAETVCLKPGQMSINGVSLLEKSDVVFKKMGQPEDVKRYKYHSDGNAGSYFLKDLIYQDLIFTIVDEKKRVNQIERMILSGPKYKLGAEFYIDQKKSEIMTLLGIKSEKEVMSLTERDLFLSGKAAKLSAASKKSWALSQCGDETGSINAEFYFDISNKLSQVKIFLDDRFI
ncbi:hypothetical protein [Iodobacter ciconiae]|uniref:Uncharacterized protein n=1 Tax=Iodobacter ciconiae TaxID=2496266 RepID=A0A3S8ZX16_9NEIS|nr:hypothetical protein [Iodobacter ciconiae]AZN37985.1 hypothetical protein EJO50_16820 [Iodobacter ciconiae]